MAVSVKFFALLFCISLINGGDSCTNADLKIKQEPIGVNVGGKPEFKVTLENSCYCVFEDIVLACDGFQTQEPIDASILSQDGGDCTINNGNPISPSSTLSFKYAWDKSFNFTLKNSQIACS